jgi:hypothetical protein
METIVIGNVTVTVINQSEFKVKVEGTRAKTFRGESAWSDAQRFANDALPVFGPQFTL